MKHIKQFNAPCEIGVECGCKTALNYKQPCDAGFKPKASRKKTRPVRKQNIIKIRIADNSKDIVIKFADKETLLKSLRELLDL